MNSITTGVLTPAQYGLLINWGCSKLDVKTTFGQVLLNPPSAVANAACKLRTFKLFKEKGVPHPKWWTKEDVAKAERKESILVARTTTRGSGGEGIVIIRPGDKVVEAPLYTQYIRKDSEYRIHVVRDEIVLIQQKRKEKEAEQTADQKLIRNYDNGWIFAANDVGFTSNEQKESCKAAAIASVRALGLDFGAVDLVVGRRDGNPYVLEVNTAPGLQSPTLLEGYANAFSAIAKGIKYNEPASKDEVGRARHIPRRADGKRARV